MQALAREFAHLDDWSNRDGVRVGSYRGRVVLIVGPTTLQVTGCTPRDHDGTIDSVRAGALDSVGFDKRAADFVASGVDTFDLLVGKPL